MSWDGCSQRREFWGGGPVSKDAAYGAVRGSIGTAYNGKYVKSSILTKKGTLE